MLWLAELLPTHASMLVAGIKHHRLAHALFGSVEVHAATQAVNDRVVFNKLTLTILCCSSSIGDFGTLHDSSGAQRAAGAGFSGFDLQEGLDQPQGASSGGEIPLQNGESQGVIRGFHGRVPGAAARAGDGVGVNAGQGVGEDAAKTNEHTRLLQGDAVLEMEPAHGRSPFSQHNLGSVPANDTLERRQSGVLRRVGAMWSAFDARVMQPMFGGPARTSSGSLRPRSGRNSRAARRFSDDMD